MRTHTSLGPNLGHPDSLAASFTVLQPAELPSAMPLPLFVERVQAGFPSPAQDYIEQRLDLNSLVILRPEATFFLQVRGHSMVDAGILDGDIVVVDRSITAASGHIVVAEIDGQFTIKTYWRRGNVVRLVPANKAFKTIELQDGETLTIFGVVTWILHRSARPR